MAVCGTAAPVGTGREVTDESPASGSPAHQLRARRGTEDPGIAGLRSGGADSPKSSQGWSRMGFRRGGGSARPVHSRPIGACCDERPQRMGPARA